MESGAKAGLPTQGSWGKFQEGSPKPVCHDSHTVKGKGDTPPAVAPSFPRTLELQLGKCTEGTCHPGPPTVLLPKAAPGQPPDTRSRLPLASPAHSGLIRVLCTQGTEWALPGPQYTQHPWPHEPGGGKDHLLHLPDQSIRWGRPGWADSAPQTGGGPEA